MVEISVAQIILRISETRYPWNVGTELRDICFLVPRTVNRTSRLKIFRDLFKYVSDAIRTALFGS